MESKCLFVHNSTKLVGCEKEDYQNKDLLAAAERKLFLSNAEVEHLAAPAPNILSNACKRPSLGVSSCREWKQVVRVCLFRRPCSLVNETTKLTRRRDSTFDTDEANDCFPFRKQSSRPEGLQSCGFVTVIQPGN